MKQFEVYPREPVTIEMAPCKGCGAVWLPEEEFHCDGCIDHAQAVALMETGGSG